MSLRPYPEYKASGIGWFEDIPSHWQLLPVFAVLQERGETNEDGEEINVLSVMKDRGVIPYSEKGNVGNKKSENIRRYKLVRQGDIVLNSMNIIIGSVGLSVYDGCLSPVYYVLGARSTHANTVYLSKVFQLKRFQRSLVRLGNGILAHRMRIPMDKLKRELLPIPPPDEQDAIVRFLDVAEKRIRRYIRAKQKLIKLLNEQKQAIIQQAVTRGLNPDVPMKDSGVEWLGEIPSHWEAKRLKAFFRECDDRTETGKETLFSLRMYDGLVPHDDVSNKPITDDDLIGYKRVQPRQVVMNRMRAAIGLFGVMPEPGLVSPDYAIFNTSDEIVPEYYVELFKTSLMKGVFFVESKGLGTGSSGFMRLYTDRFGNIFAPKPPKSEQLDILAYINSATNEQSIAVEQTKRQIDLATEYGTRLIADVVTGKVDVRGLVFEMPEEFDDDLEDDFEDESSLEDEMELEDIGDE